MSVQMLKANWVVIPSESATENVISLVENLTAEQESMKEKRRSTKHILKTHYLEEIRRISQSLQSERSLLQTMVKLLHIKEEIPRSSFPDYLDETSITFLTSAASLELSKYKQRGELKEITFHPQLPSSSSSSISFNSVMSSLMEHRRVVLKEGYHPSS